MQTSVSRPRWPRSINKLKVPEILVVPFVSDEMIYQSADVEDRYVIAQANTLAQ